jgi:hypothetical protein
MTLKVSHLIGQINIFLTVGLQIKSDDMKTVGDYACDKKEETAASDSMLQRYVEK